MSKRARQTIGMDPLPPGHRFRCATEIKMRSSFREGRSYIRCAYSHRYLSISLVSFSRSSSLLDLATFLTSSQLSVLSTNPSSQSCSSLSLMPHSPSPSPCPLLARMPVMPSTRRLQAPKGAVSAPPSAIRFSAQTRGAHTALRRLPVPVSLVIVAFSYERSIPLTLRCSLSLPVRSVYAIDQLLLLASSPLVAKEHRYVEHVLAQSGLPQILRSNRLNKPTSGKGKRSGGGKNSKTAPAPAPTPIAKIHPVRSTAYGKQHPIGHERRGSNSSSGSGQQQEQSAAARGRGSFSSSSWKHSWNEVSALQSWRS